MCTRVRACVRVKVHVAEAFASVHATAGHVGQPDVRVGEFERLLKHNGVRHISESA